MFSDFTWKKKFFALENSGGGWGEGGETRTLPYPPFSTVLYVD